MSVHLLCCIPSFLLFVTLTAITSHYTLWTTWASDPEKHSLPASLVSLPLGLVSNFGWHPLRLLCPSHLLLLHCQVSCLEALTLNAPDAFHLNYKTNLLFESSRRCLLILDQQNSRPGSFHLIVCSFTLLIEMLLWLISLSSVEWKPS